MANELRLVGGVGGIHSRGWEFSVIDMTLGIVN